MAVTIQLYTSKGLRTKSNRDSDIREMEAAVLLVGAGNLQRIAYLVEKANKGNKPKAVQDAKAALIQLFLQKRQLTDAHWAKLKSYYELELNALPGITPDTARTTYAKY